MDENQKFSDYWIFKPFIENFSQKEKEKAFDILYQYIKLCVTAKQTQSIDKAIDLGLNINFKIHNTQFDLLKKAVREGENKVVQYLCKHQIDINTVDYKKETSLHSLVKHFFYFLEDHSENEIEIKNRIDILYTLFEYNINPFIKNEENKTAFDIVEKFIETRENFFSFLDSDYNKSASLVKNQLKSYQQKYIMENKKTLKITKKSIL